MRAALTATFLLLAPRVSLACSVCMSGREEANRAAFIGTTALLTVLPLIIIGGTVWYLRKRARALEAEARNLP